MVRKHLGPLVIQDMPSLRADGVLPNEDQRQLQILVNQRKSHPGILTYVRSPYIAEERKLKEFVPGCLRRRLGSIDPARLIDSTSGFFDLGAGNLARLECIRPDPNWISGRIWWDRIERFNRASSECTICNRHGQRRQDRRDYKGLALTPPCPPQRA
ncbi:uncharacterized protein RSE6_12629 [Rhynchosporium secalis]|uniref:Uncharacterized protein n=1 Tax=Rhynchosporium secalis TaxID=38038 RepID=A0A1E1MQW7_RHYSE|nr:uncharacterized protein RSE6_12629 [Rhynchosporium secalis]